MFSSAPQSKRNRITHLFRVLEVLEHGLLGPCNTLVDVGSGVGEALGLSGLATEDTTAQYSQLEDTRATDKTYP